MKTTSSPYSEAYASWLASVSNCCASVARSGSRPTERGGSEKPQITIVRDQPGLVQPPHADYYHQNDAFRPSTRSSQKEWPRKSFTSGRTSFSLRRRLRPGSSSGRGGSGNGRLQISAPTNFRHLNSQTFQFPEFDPDMTGPTTLTQPKRASFRPLQLSIYQSENAISPLLPHFVMPSRNHYGYDQTQQQEQPHQYDAMASAFEEDVVGVDGDRRLVTPPPRARVRGGSDADSLSSSIHRGHGGGAMTHERSYSSLSFHVPRRLDSSPKFGLNSRSPSISQQNRQQQQQQQQHTTPPPKVPPKSRARAHTSPEAERLAERIASALLEKEKLQELINECVERQSIYLGSRPSTAHSMAFSTTGFEPMPAIPALPPTAPSFAERLNTTSSDRPTTAPARPSPMPSQHLDDNALATAPTPAFSVAPLAMNPTNMSPMTPTRKTVLTADDRPLQPPLPLVLRPPLRKKKSFSRVSTWLFPAGEHPQEKQFQHENSLTFDSITNNPRPVRGNEGFYQCVSPSDMSSPSSSSPAADRRQHRGGLSSGASSSWDTEEDDDDDEKTMPTTWSPGSSPATKTADGSSLFDRVSPLGGMDVPAATPTRMVFSPRREIVGVAF